MDKSFSSELKVCALYPCVGIFNIMMTKISWCLTLSALLGRHQMNRRVVLHDLLSVFRMTMSTMLTTVMMI